MKIKLERYYPGRKAGFENIRTELLQQTGFLRPVIEHIGSTSVEGLSAKPIIDILVGLQSEKDLSATIQPLTEKNYIYYERFNKEMPYRRFFVKHKIHPEELAIPSIITEKDAMPSDTFEHDQRLAHIHIVQYQSIHWIRHIAFRDYLKAYTDISQQYQILKEELCKREWTDGNEYNKAKDKFIKLHEKKAVQWYHEQQLQQP